MEGVAACEATQRDPGAAQHSMASKGLLRIEGAGRVKAADIAEERRDYETVEAQECATESRRTGSCEIV